MGFVLRSFYRTHVEKTEKKKRIKECCFFASVPPHAPTPLNISLARSFSLSHSHSRFLSLSLCLSHSLSLYHTLTLTLPSLLSFCPLRKAHARRTLCKRDTFSKKRLLKQRYSNVGKRRCLDNVQSFDEKYLSFSAAVAAYLSSCKYGGYFI